MYAILTDYYFPYVQKVAKGEVPMFMIASAVLCHYHFSQPKHLGVNTRTLMGLVLPSK